MPRKIEGKILPWPRLIECREEWRHAGCVVVWTNGCFDLLHIGHIQSLAAARNFGDVLVVGLHSDASVRRLKGPQRPIILAEERALILAALECVDAVVIFDEDTPEQAIMRLKPDIHVKGADYAPPSGKPIPEAALVQSYGGQIRFVPLVDAHSTSSLIEKIQGR